jgi:hypothetical protein
MEEVWRSLQALRDQVPKRVDDNELVARRVREKAIKGGKVKYQAFIYATQFPCEVSVDRTRYCDAPAKAAKEGKVAVFLRTGDVRGIGFLDSEKPPREHAEILCPAVDATGKRYPNKEAVDAVLWEQFELFCMDLSDLVRFSP